MMGELASWSSISAVAHLHIHRPLANSSSLRPNSPAARGKRLTSPSPSRESSAAAFDENAQRDLAHLCRADIFRPIPPNIIPQAFVDSPHVALQGASVSDLVANGQFYAAAVASAQQLASISDHSDTSRIFELFYTRLACLTLINKTCQEIAAMESLELRDLTGTFYRHPVTNEHLVNWDLRILAVRLQSIGFKDWRRGIMAFYTLAQDARQEISKARLDGQSQDERLWKSRLLDVGIRVASMLAEMGDLDAAARHLRTIEIEEDLEDDEKKRVTMMASLLWLQIGDLRAAKRCISPISDEAGSDEPTNISMQVFAALVKMAEGEFAAAVTAWEQLKEIHPTDAMISQNLAICLLYTGRVTEAHRILETAVAQSASVPSHSLLFNLCTVYELCSERAQDMKDRLTERVATVKPSSLGWERSTADFKLEGIRT
jgi:tetratricopeptide (TPR) repeat protein